MKKINYTQILDKLENVNTSEFLYKDNNTKSKLICLEHGAFYRNIRQIKKGILCNSCSSKIKDTNSFIRESLIVHSDKYDYSVTRYINSRNKVSINCKEHGIFEMFPIQHIRGQGCNECKFVEMGSKFIEESIKIHNYNYSLVKYINNKTKVKVICDKHGIFEVRPDNHLYNLNGCPSCKLSNGELVIYNYLTKNKILFEEQKKFFGCLLKNMLRFDFYLPDYNICIEYNGIQHYEKVKYFGDQETLDYNKIKDEIKEKYCIENNILLFVIKYSDDISLKLIELKKLIDNY